MSSTFRGVGVEVSLRDSEDFLKIKETLTRIGVSSQKHQTLYQSCHILHKRDVTGSSRYAIVHFKEMFKLDGKPSSLEEKDIQRRNSIVNLLEEWNLLDVIDQNFKETVQPNSRELMSNIKVLSFKEKDQWNLVAKYKIGKNERTNS